MTKLHTPKAPPFPVGTCLRYIGKHVTNMQAVPSPRDIDDHPEDWVAIQKPGLIVVIAEVYVGRVGTGKQLRDSDGPMFYEDSGEPILDETRDGHSTYYVEACGRKHGRMIRPETAGEWERLDTLVTP